jgi:hypothetical protein
MKHSLCLLVASSLALPACGGDEEKPEEPKAEKKPKKDTKKPLPKPKEDDLRPELKLDLSGAKAPEASTVFFAVDGALIPIACWDKAGGKIKGGPDCRSLVKAGDEVYVASEFTKALDTVGEAKNALCEVADSPTSLAAATVDGGASYDFAMWPKAAHDLMAPLGADTRSERARDLDSAEEEALKKAISAVSKKADAGDLRPQQRAELDIDGDGKAELFLAAVVAHPKDPDRNLFSGLFMAPGGDVGAMVLIDQSKRDADIVTLRGAVDLDGNGKHELWVGLQWDGGSGDRVVTLDGGKAKALGKWSCGA